MSVPVNITGMAVANAKLPASYANAKLAIAKCEHIDECKDWADKAEALASYAKQAGDRSLLVMAKRIQTRAIRRCGDLLLELKRPEQGGRPPKNGGGTPPVSQRQAAKDAGLSKDQQKTAVRVARVPSDEFEAAVESEDPPTVTELAERGTKKQEEEDEQPTFDLQGRDPEEFKLATQALGRVRMFVEVTSSDPHAVARGSLPSEWEESLLNIRAAMAWLTMLQLSIEVERERK